MSEGLTKSLEDYLEAILIIFNNKGEVRVKDLMNFFNYKVSSVNQALKQLKAKGYILHEKYGSVKLTEKGRDLANEIYAKHRALVDFLIEILGVESSVAEHDGCSFEHFIHPETFKKFSAMSDFFKKNPDCLDKLKNFLEGIK